MNFSKSFDNAGRLCSLGGESKILISTSSVTQGPCSPMTAEDKFHGLGWEGGDVHPRQHGFYKCSLHTDSTVTVEICERSNPSIINSPPNVPAFVPSTWVMLSSPLLHVLYSTPGSCMRVRDLCHHPSNLGEVKARKVYKKYIYVSQNTGRLTVGRVKGFAR